MATRAELNDAISDAHEALEELDHHDLNSSDAASVAIFDRITKEHDEAVSKVISLAKLM